MKKLFLALTLFLAGVGRIYADTPASSSYTATNDTQLLRSQTSTNTIVRTLVGVIVSSPSSVGLLKIYNSTYTTAGSTVATISLATVQNYDFHSVVLRGIYYITTGNSNGVTILYRD